MHRTCVKCKKSKPLTQFHKNRTYRRRECKTCRSQYAKTNYKENKKDILNRRKPYSTRQKVEKRFRSWLAQGIKLTLQEYYKKLAKQHHSCKICKSPFKNTRDAHVDHQHTTGKVRGILCSKCNTALGLLKDDPNLLLRAAKYLNENNLPP